MLAWFHPRGAERERRLRHPPGRRPDALARDLQDRFPRARLTGGDPEFEELVAKVVGFVEAPSLGLDLLLDVRGTAFQHRVWQALREILAGSTASYADIAKRIGTPKSVRSVAGACAANAIAVATPAIVSCERTACSPATAGASSASARCSNGTQREHSNELPVEFCCLRKKRCGVAASIPLRLGHSAPDNAVHRAKSSAQGQQRLKTGVEHRRQPRNLPER
jgi:O-6-methylguanine DNA methyltransferase